MVASFTSTHLETFQSDMMGTGVLPIGSAACISPTASAKSGDFVQSASDIERTVSPDIESLGTKTTKTAPKGKKPAKQVTKARRKWKKPADKPKRPLSAYNLYFKDQREKIIRGQVSNWTQARGFKAMAQFIAGKWNTLDGNSRSLYEARATEEKKVYFAKLAQWKRAKKQKELLEEMSLLQMKGTGQLSMPMTAYSQAFQDSCFLPTENTFNNALSSSAGYNKMQESLEPLPVEYPVNTMENVGSSWLSGGPSFPDKSYQSSPLDSLDSLFENTEEPRKRRDSLTGFIARQLWSDQSPEQDSTVMKRVLATFDVLDVDEDFANFMSSMEWK